MKRYYKTPPTKPEELIADWVKAHGEAVTVKEAADLIGVHPQTIYRRIYAGDIQATPEKRVLVRSLCLYANGYSA